MTAFMMSWRQPRPAAAGMLPVLERNLIVYRRLFLTLISGFFEPVFYLAAVGYGMGSLVADQVLDGGRVVDYPTYVAPALLAASVMNGAVFDSTLNFFYKLRYSGVYHGMLATPLGIGNVMVGEVVWALLRGTLYGIGFIAVTAALGLVTSWWALLGLPALLLIGAAFAALGMAATTFVRTWQDTNYFQLVLLPMFLLSGTFYPLSVMPGWLRPVVEASPLYHAVALVRGLMLTGPSYGLAVHAAYLAALAAAGTWVCVRRFHHLYVS